MKRYVYSTADLEEEFYIPIKEIISITLVDDVNDYNPRDYLYVSASSMDYTSLTQEQLLKLPKKELENIHDIRVLRKLDRSDLSPQQFIEVKKANAEKFESSIKQVKEALARLKDCGAVFVERSSKNVSFAAKLNKLGARLSNDDVWDIVDQLHVKDYTHSTLSYLDKNWNCLLIVFEYKGDHTFRPRRKNDDPVTVENMDVYIKIDIDNETGNGYAVMSFHDPEFKMNHPYADYPIDKE